MMMISETSANLSARDNPVPLDGGTEPPEPNPSATLAPPLLPPLPPPLPQQHLNLVCGNAQGLNDTSKVSDVYRHLRSLNASVVLLQETKLTAEATLFPTALWKGTAIFGCADSSSLGVAVLIAPGSPLVPDVTRALKGARFVIVPCTWEGKSVTIVNTYAPNLPADREVFFSDLAEMISDLRQPPDARFIWGGDFNSVESPLDKLGGAPPTLLPTSFRALQAEHDLHDAFRTLHPTTREFTWANVLTSTRIDMIFVSRTLLPSLNLARHDLPIRSDHKMVLASLRSENPVQTGKGVWSLDPSFLAAPIFKTELTSITSTTLPADFPTYSEWFTTLTARIKDAALQFKKRQAQLKDAKLRELTAALRSLENTLLSSPDDRTVRLSIKEIKKEIHLTTQKKLDHLRLHSAAVHFKDGEKCTRYFAAFAKKRRDTNLIRKLEPQWPGPHHPAGKRDGPRVLCRTLRRGRDQRRCRQLPP
jgi:exonuclease III